MNNKNIFIIIISSILIISLFFNLSKFNGVSNDKYSELETKNQKLQKYRDSLLVVNSNLSNTFQSMQDEIDKREDSILVILSDLKKAQDDLKKQKDKTSRLEKEKRVIESKIDNLLKNPVKREDDDLLKSLKNKLKP